MKKTRDEIQKEAVEALVLNNGGTAHVLTGGGKCKIGIDYLMRVCKPSDNVQITVPLTPLVKTWADEFRKWTECSGTNDKLVVVVPNGYIEVYINTIQSVYNDRDVVTHLIVDEIHTTVTEAYSAVFSNILHDTCVGLTATPDTLRREDKQLLYDMHCPIVYEYLEGEADGVVNTIQFKIVEHELNDSFKVKVGPKHKQWSVGEKKQYEYLSQQIHAGQIAMAVEGSSNYFTDASEWFWQKKGNKGQLEAGRKYLGSISSRRKFLLSLQSSSEISKRLAKSIILENSVNKVLVFSEQVEQIKKICKYNVYGEQDDKLNAEIINAFNDGDIRAMGSCYSLTLGQNLVGATHSILESYQGSDTKATQRIGRLHRLDPEDLATIYIIKILNTQSAQWFDSMMCSYDLSNAEIISSNSILT